MVIRLDDLGENSGPVSGRYEFAASGQRHGVRSTISLPMVVAGEHLGALNLYPPVPHGFSHEVESTLADIASVAAVVFSNATAYQGAYRLSVQLREAMESRATMEQAKGVLTASRRGITPDEAFEMLRSASQRENVKLRAIASASSMGPAPSLEAAARHTARNRSNPN